MPKSYSSRSNRHRSRKIVPFFNLKLNENIPYHTFTLITEDGQKIDHISKPDALILARERNLDLFLVHAKNNIVTVKLVNYGKLKYLQSKKDKKMRKNQKVILIKEIRLKPSIGDHDLDFKLRKIREFLKDGNKVKITLWFRGRELSHKEQGEILLNKIISSVEDLAHPDGPIKKQYRSFIVMLVVNIKKNP